MTEIVLANEDFQEFIGPLLGLTVSLPWQGHGSAIFLELGTLTPSDTGPIHGDIGEACISVEWDWRVEAEAAVLYGSANRRPNIQAGILSLKGTTIQSLSVVGRVPELVIQFSNGHCLRSMVMITGDPEWAITVPDGRWVGARSGRLVVDRDELIRTDEECSVLALAERTAARWGTPRVEPELGKCSSCAFFIPLDGNWLIHDYGCCVAEAGPFDGRVVCKQSGCPAFTSYEES